MQVLCKPFFILRVASGLQDEEIPQPTKKKFRVLPAFGQTYAWTHALRGKSTLFSKNMGQDQNQESTIHQGGGNCSVT